MNDKEAQRELVRIAADLDEAIEQLVSTPTAAAGWPVTLKRALASLERTRGQLRASAAKRAFRPLLDNIQQRVRRVQLLVDAAAMFYWGCVAVTKTQGAGYTHEGAFEEVALGGRMQLEA